MFDFYGRLLNCKLTNGDLVLAFGYIGLEAFKKFGALKGLPLWLYNSTLPSHIKFNIFGRVIPTAGFFCTFTGNDLNSKYQNESPFGIPMVRVSGMNPIFPLFKCFTFHQLTV